jgi:hypothetical protein
LRRFFITDDNFARNKDWEPILDRLIYLRNEAKLAFSLTIQVDTLSQRLPNFIQKCKRANVRQVFIGLENINPANLAAAKKKPKQDHRISQDAARLEIGGHSYLCRLYPWFSQ